VIERVVPAGVAVAETRTDLDEPLHPAEEAAVARAVPRRRQEFRTVRACARTALAELGVDRPPLVPGERGAPSWPAGVVGSMTHCDGYRAAAVARTTTAAGLGIDAEPHGPLPDGVLDLVASTSEREHLADLARRDPAVRWDRVLFSAKESVYKTWSPLTGAWLAFEEVLLTVEPGPGAGGFTAQLLARPAPPHDGVVPTALAGRWLVEDGLVVTGVVLPGRP